MNESLKKNTVELLKRASTQLPPDVIDALEKSYMNEHSERGMMNLRAILTNVEMAGKQSIPMCQDTGAPTFWIYHPVSYSRDSLIKTMDEALGEATKRHYLRPNAVDPLGGKNSGDNTGIGTPTYHFFPWKKDKLVIELLLKGGGSENVSAQYKLPDSSIGANRDLDGARRCVIDAVFKAQGRGCAPGVIGVAIGGSRDTGFAAAKRALMRKFNEDNPIPELEKLERTLLDELNTLDIGPMGLGGRTTVLAVKATALHRLPACYYVTISYNCWAMRRKTMTIWGGEVSYD